jgi:hypothetical protein
VEFHLQSSIELHVVAFNLVRIVALYRMFTHVSEQLTRRGFIIIFSAHLTTQEETEITLIRISVRQLHEYFG